MSGQVSRGSAGEYQADERAGVARLRCQDSPVLGPCGGATARLVPLDRTESKRHGIWGMRKLLKYVFGSWKSEVKARRDQMKSFNDSFRPHAKVS